MINKRIVIIGAGATGIVIATQLLSNGFNNIVLLEADQRINAGNICDLSAQWYHDQANNRAYDLGKDGDCLSSGTNLIVSNGQRVEEFIVDKLMHRALSILNSSDIAEWDGSLGSFIEVKFNEAVRGETIDAELVTQFLVFFERLQDSFDAFNSWSDISCKLYAEYKTRQRELLLNWKDKDYTTVVDLIKHQLENKNSKLRNSIQLSKEVSAVNYSLQGNNAVQIKCTDDTSYQADHVICAIPLDVLKMHHDGLFCPKLPATKINAMESIGICRSTKIFLEYDTAFWPIDWKGFGVLWNENDLKDICIKTGYSWLRDVFQFLTVGLERNVLCAGISGPSTYQVENASVEQLKDGLTMLLKAFIKDWSIPYPKHIALSKCLLTSHCHGPYSRHSMDSDVANAFIPELSQPLTDTHDRPVVQFAGHATHLNFSSSIYGAIETGFREANRLIQFYKDTNLKIKATITNDLQQYGLIESETMGPKQNQNHGCVVDVLILGAGLAGLGFATALKQYKNRKCSFLILEGQHRAGGRIHTVNLLDNASKSNDKQKEQVKSNEKNFIEEGAQWLHGKYNYLHEISEKYDLLSEIQSEEGEGVYLTPDGTEIDEYIVKRTDFVIGQILEKCEEFAHNDSNELYPKSVEHFLLEKFESYVNELETDEAKRTAKNLLDWHLRFQIIDNSCLNLSSVSAKFWGNYSFNGESCQAHYNFRNGFSDAITNLVKELGTDPILYNKHVIEISITEANDVNDEDLIDTKPRVSVKCSDGSIYKANHVLVTFSLGVLKQNYNSMFHPRLPYRYERAICDIGFETINKVYLQFDESWWGDTDGIQLVFDDGNLNEHSHWTRWISGFDVMNPGPSNTLLGWVGGKGAIDMELLSDQQLIEDCMVLLRKFTKCNVPSPKRYYCTRWRSNGFIRGAYSYISTDCDSSDTSISVLTDALYQKDFWPESKCVQTACDKISFDDSVNNLDRNNPFNLRDIHSQLLNVNDLAKSPVMIFAGEACHSKYFSTAHGAFLSGIEQADKILHFY